MDDGTLQKRLESLLILPKHRDSLVKNGYAIVDGAFDVSHAHQLLEEMRSFERNGDFSPNRVQFTIPGRSKPIIATKPGVFEIDLHDDEKRKKAPCFSALFAGDAFVHALQVVESSTDVSSCNRTHSHYGGEFDKQASNHNTERQSATLPVATMATAEETRPVLAQTQHSNDAVNAVRLQSGTHGKTIKLQVNTGGAFPLHYDNPGRPNRRRWTCLLYLNVNWKQGDGGELVLLPFGSSPAGVVVPPLFNRLLVFRSDLLLHRVLISKRPRYCFTVWVDAVSSDVNKDEDIFLKQKHLRLPLPELLTMLRQSPLQRVISRAVYQEVYRESLLMCIRGSATQGADNDATSSATLNLSNISEGSRYMLAAHMAQVKNLMSNPSLSLVITAIRSFIARQADSM